MNDPEKATDTGKTKGINNALPSVPVISSLPPLTQPENVKQIAQQNYQHILDWASVMEVISTDRDVAMYPKRVPEFIKALGAEYGGMNAVKFSQMHKAFHHNGNNSPVSVIDIYSSQPESIPAMKSADFEKLLNQLSGKYSRQYQEQFRSKALGGCNTVNKEFIDQANINLKIPRGDGRFIRAAEFAVPAHYFALANVEGVLYAIDFTFTQFSENSHAANWDKRHGTSNIRGPVIFPIGTAGSGSIKISKLANPQKGKELIESLIIEKKPGRDESANDR